MQKQKEWKGVRAKGCKAATNKPANLQANGHTRQRSQLQNSPTKNLDQPPKEGTKNGEPQ